MAIIERSAPLFESIEDENTDVMGAEVGAAGSSTGPFNKAIVAFNVNPAITGPDSGVNSIRKGTRRSSSSSHASWHRDAEDAEDEVDEKAVANTAADGDATGPNAADGDAVDDDDEEEDEIVEVGAAVDNEEEAATSLLREEEEKDEEEDER